MKEKTATFPKKVKKCLFISSNLIILVLETLNSLDEAVQISSNSNNVDEVTTDNEVIETIPFSLNVHLLLQENTINPFHLEEEPKLSAWAKKQRKFKCDLCPSSFKRSSHLTRHQLVHTVERPFACDQCDKAFSRHDKLKHHIRKTHEQDYETDYKLEMSHSLVPSRSSTPLPFVSCL